MSETEQVDPLTLIEADNGTKVIKITNGPFHDKIFSMPAIGEILEINHVDVDTGTTLISEYRLAAIHSLLVWEYKWLGTYVINREGL